MTNTSPKGQRVPVPPAEVVVAAAARPRPGGRVQNQFQSCFQSAATAPSLCL